jgi:hypothetical protein
LHRNQTVGAILTCGHCATGLGRALLLLTQARFGPSKTLGSGSGGFKRAGGHANSDDTPDGGGDGGSGGGRGGDGEKWW